MLKNIFCTTLDDVSVFIAVIRMAKSNAAWNDESVTVSRHRILGFLTRTLATHHFDESIRWQPQERAFRNPHITALIDHTTTKLKWSMANHAKVMKYFNLHKGMCYKYLVTCTPQGTPIRVSVCQPGRRHDYHLFCEPLAVHTTRDWILADGGYRGLGPHFTFPLRKPNLRNFTPAQERHNFLFGRVRSRIERCFGIIKRFKILASTLLEPQAHELFFRFLVLCEHHVRTKRNLAGNTPYPHAAGAIPQGTHCRCDWNKL